MFEYIQTDQKRDQASYTIEHVIHVDKLNTSTVINLNSLSCGHQGKNKQIR